MGNGRYIQSKKIIGQEDLPYHFLNLCKDPETKNYFLFLSEVERPSSLKREDILTFPGKTRDANIAQGLFKKINSVDDFVLEARKKSSIILDG